jgi:uroporphyrinogen-III synthase
MAVHSPASVLLTRPQAASERFAKALDGMDVVIAPLMEIVSTGADVALHGVEGVVLTSEAAVAFLPPGGLPAYCVGPRTTEAARAAGFDAVEAGPDAEALVAGLLAEIPKGPLLHVRGLHQRGDVAKRLSDGGVPTREVVVYDQHAVQPDPAFRDAINREGLLVPLFSPRSAALFAEAAQRLPPHARLIAMSDAVAEALPEAMRAHTTVLTAPNGAEMAKALRAAALRRISP